MAFDGGSEAASLEKLFGLTLSGEQVRLVRIYLDLLGRWNRRINLTALETEEQQLRLNFFEAFWAAREFLAEAGPLADVGSGAGFPGLAMKIYRPELSLRLIEANRKKAVFLTEAVRALGLEAEVFAGRGENYEGWAGVDIVSFRALRPSEELIQRLSQVGVKLLLFEGRSELPWPGLIRLRRRLVPGSENRYVCLARTTPGRGADGCFT